MTAFGILKHVHLIYDHGADSPQALLGTYDLIYALIGPGDDICIKALRNLPALSETNPAHAHPNRCSKSQLPVGRELIELLIG